MHTAPSQKTLLERALSIVTEVRAGEGVSALLLAANAFYLLAFYQVLKLVREALILSESGAVAASYAAAGMAAILFIFVPAYSAFAARVNRVWLVCGVTLFFASHLLIFWALGSAGVRIGVAFYIWIGVFNMVAVAQFWAFANDVYSSERGKRLFPLVGVGATLGAALGSLLATLVFGGIGPYVLMLIAAAGLLVPIALTIIVNRREAEMRRDAQVVSEQPLAKGSNGFKLVLTNRYLLLIALMVLVFNLVNTLGGFMLNDLITKTADARIAAGLAAAADRRAIIATLSGTVLSSVNILAFILQTFAVSRIFKHIGVRGALFILPVLALVNYSIIAVAPILAIVRVGKILENSTDYSIQNTIRPTLFLATSREAKYKAKAAIDTFFTRLGDFLFGVLVYAGDKFSVALSVFAWLNVGLTVLWLFAAGRVAREHRKRTV